MPGRGTPNWPSSTPPIVVTEQSFYLKIDMRLSCPPGSTSPFQKQSGASTSQRTSKPLLGNGLSGLEIYHSTEGLSALYQLNKDRNHRLLQLSLNLSRDINFLKEYCKCLELQLQTAGFYRQKRFERLSRKETAATIFDNYLDSSTLLSEWTNEGPLHDELASLRVRNSSLEQQNKQLQLKLGNQRLRLHKSVQVEITDLAKLARESQMAQERINVLNTEVSHLRHVNAAFQLEERKRGVQASILQASKQVFDKIHQIMREYRRKMSALAHEKREIEKKYRILKENARLLDSGSHSKLIDLLAEKVDILEKLVEKQQLELENTITVYEGELANIEQKRRQELEFFQNERIGLESENLRLCIDVQKALNRQDSTNLLLVRQKNTTDRLSKEMVRLTQNLNSMTSKEAQLKGRVLRLDSGVVKFYGESFISCASERRQLNVRNSYHSAGFKLSNDENSNQSNFEYQFSEVSQTDPFEKHLPEMKKKKEEGEPGRYKGIEKIKITYNSYLAPGPRASPYPTLGRVYDSAVQYKRRLVESKPDSSSNHNG